MIRRVLYVAIACLVAFILSKVVKPAPAVTCGACPSCCECKPEQGEHPSGTTMAFAKRLTIARKGALKIITVNNPWVGADRDFTYVLYPRDGDKPDYPDAHAVISYPLKRIVVTSTTYLPYLETLGKLDAVVGVTNPELIYSPAMRKRVEQGKVKTIGGSQGTSGDLNLEGLLMLKPDAVIAHASGSPEHDVYPQIHKAGIATVLCAEYMENTPLGRSEWYKFFGALMDCEAAAEAECSRIEARYAELKQLTAGVKDKPKVLVNIAYRGAWYVPGGKSYMACFLEDAGADFPWKDNNAIGGVQLDYENILVKAADAEIWLNPGRCNSLSEVAEVDPRYREFVAFKTGRIYNHTRLKTPAGGYDYWERGASRPDLVLADLIALFHPELLPDHSFEWYVKLPENRDE